MKKIIPSIIFLALVVLVAGYFWQQNHQLQTNNTKNTQNINQPVNQNINQVQKQEEYAYLVTFEFDSQDIISLEYPYTFSPDQSLFIITQELAQAQNWDFNYQEYEGLGILVTQINDKTNGDDQKYWQYYVDNVQPQISADKYYPKYKEHITWKFIEPDL